MKEYFRIEVTYYMISESVVLKLSKVLSNGNRVYTEAGPGWRTKIIYTDSLDKYYNLFGAINNFVDRE